MTRNYSFEVQQVKKRTNYAQKIRTSVLQKRRFFFAISKMLFIHESQKFNELLCLDIFFLVRIIFPLTPHNFCFFSPTITGIEILEHFSSRWLELAENWSVLLSIGHWGEGVDGCDELKIITMTHSGSRNRKHLATLRWILEIFIFEGLSECGRSINSNPRSTLP